jgi:hypothetical protein
MNRTNLTTALLAFAVVACQSEQPAGVQGSASPSPSATTSASASPAQSPSSPAASSKPSERKEGSFGALVGNADRVTIRITRIDGKVAAGDKPMGMDAAWVKKLAEAVGADTMASDVLPRCMPTYTLVFSEKGKEVARFGAVCDGDAPFVLIHDKTAFVAADSESAHALVTEAKPK